ncbi:MAG TPA: hypothetical protein VFH73_25760 [Polyangia bacterium]|nr:hypothetical protein [Polyangia bacterium]
MATARSAQGVRLVVASALPSPWSEGAKALFRVKQIPAQLVRFARRDDELAAWTRTHNAPVAFYDDEPPRSGWAEILALAERLGGRQALIPTSAAARVRLHGTAHELLGEGGLAWGTRLLMTHGSLASDGRESWPLPVAQYLAAKYGYAPEQVPAARARAREVLALLAKQLDESHAAGHTYLLGADVSALDLYLATTLTIVVPTAAEECPGLSPALGPALAFLNQELGPDLPAALIAHRRMVLDRYLPGPIAL